MSQKWILRNAFEEIPFSRKVKMGYFEWCLELLKVNFNKKIYKDFKYDILYYKTYFSPKIFMYIVLLFIYIILLFIWISNLFLFPLYAFVFKFYWSNRYSKTLKNGEAPISDIIVHSVVNPIFNGMKVIKILEEYSDGEHKSYKMLLENKEVVLLHDNDLLSKNILLIKKDKLEKELKNLEYQLTYFEQKEKEA